jgi:hypothetical protein
MGDLKNADRILVRKSEQKGLFRQRRDANIKTYLKKVKWMYLAQVMVKLRDLLKAAINLWVR